MSRGGPNPRWIYCDRELYEDVVRMHYPLSVPVFSPDGSEVIVDLAGNVPLSDELVSIITNRGGRIMDSDEALDILFIQWRTDET